MPRGRKPKNTSDKIDKSSNTSPSTNTNTSTSTSTSTSSSSSTSTSSSAEKSAETKKRGRRSKKHPTILEIIKKEYANNISKSEGEGKGGGEGEGEGEGEGGGESDNNFDISLIEDEISTVKFNDVSGNIENDDDDDDFYKKSKYLFKMRTLQTSTIKSLIEALKELLVETNIECSKSGIKIIAFNNNKERAIYLHLHANKFEYFKCIDEKVYMGVSFQYLYQRIKGLNNNCTLKLFMEKDNTDKLGIVIYDHEKSLKISNYLKLYELNITKNEITNNPKYSIVVYISASIFQRICRDMSSIGEKVTITVYNRQLILKCQEKEIIDSGSQEIVINESENYMQFVKSSENDSIIRATYNLKDILQFTKCSNISGSGTMKLYFDNNKPLIIEYDVGGLGTMKLILTNAQ